MIPDLNIHRITDEKTIWASLSDRHREISSIINEEVLKTLLTGHLESLNDSWEIQADIRFVEYEIVCRIAKIEGHDFDDARNMVIQYSNDLGTRMESEFASSDLKRILFGEQRGILKRFLLDECNVGATRIEEVIKGINSIDELRLAAESISKAHQGASSIDYRKRISNWEKNVKKLARRYFYTLDMEIKINHDLANELYSDIAAAPFHNYIESEELYDFIRFIFSRISKVPRLKDLPKPTIVMIGGISGTGKSTISQHVATTLNIPIYSSTDVVAREVVRNVISWVLGKESARSTFPELFGSSFEGSDLSWYYSHSMMTMIGVNGMLEKLIQDGTSAVIEGVPLIPGTVPEKFFEQANIVWIVSCINDPQEHFKRYAGRDNAGVSRGGSKRYQKQFEDIREIHDRLIQITDSAGALRLDNTGDLKETLSFALDRVMDPFADKGLWIRDDLRDRSFFELAGRRSSLDIVPSGRKEKERALRSHSHPEICGPSISLVENAILNWVSRRKKETTQIEKMIEKKEDAIEVNELSEMTSRIEACNRDIDLAMNVIEPKYVLNLLRNNFEYLRATRSLLIQLRSLQVDLLTRLSNLPGINYDEARSEVHRVFRKEGGVTGSDGNGSTIKDLMFRELCQNIKGFLETEYNIDERRSDREMSKISNIGEMRGSLDSFIKSLFLDPIKRDISRIQILNIMDIWERNLDQTIEKNHEIYLKWKDLFEAEFGLLHNDPSMVDIKERIEKEELHRLIRWITPRLYEVPKVKDLEKRPTLILVNGTMGPLRSSILNRVSKLLSIPTCFTSDIVENVVSRTIEWLLGNERAHDTFNGLYGRSDNEDPLRSFYGRAVLTMIGVKGALNRLIKENTSAVVIGDSVIPSMLEERYFERSNIIGLVTSADEGQYLNEDIGPRLKELAASGHTMVIDDPLSEPSLELIRARVTSPYADRGLPVNDDIRDSRIEELENSRAQLSTCNGIGFAGAILTDIDDTLIPSGVTPDEEWISSFDDLLRSLSRKGILWVPMSGVALTKLGKRLLYRLPEGSLSNVIAYLGDGSNKHQYDEIGKFWASDPDFIREFSDAQSVAIIGSERYFNELLETTSGQVKGRSLLERVEEAVTLIEHHNERVAQSVRPIETKKGLIGELEDLLEESGLVVSLRKEGFDIKDPETYFRGGSVSWMMLGDISTESYNDRRSLVTRKEDLIPYTMNRLNEHNDLADLGSIGIHVPFPGARGLKFVLMGNDKERGARDLISTYDIPLNSVLFIGNELFKGGNDNMLRNIDGITLLSVGSEEDLGVIDGGSGVEANWSLMKRIADELESGRSFADILKELGD